MNPLSSNKKLLAAALGGALLGAPVTTVIYRAIVPSALATTATVHGILWTQESSGRPHRFAIDIDTVMGAHAGGRQLVCENDGTLPRLNGVVVNDDNLIAACALLPVFDTALTRDIAAASTLLNTWSPDLMMPPPHDMTHAPVDMGAPTNHGG